MKPQEPFNKAVIAEYLQAEQRSANRFVEFLHLRDFLFLFLGGEIGASVACMAVATLAKVTNNLIFTVLILGLGLLCYLLLVYKFCIRIYLAERSPRLFFKTSLPILILTIGLAVSFCFVGHQALIWGFAPFCILRYAINWNTFRLPDILQAAASPASIELQGNLISVIASGTVLLLVYLLSFLRARSIERRIREEEADILADLEYTP